MIKQMHEEWYVGVQKKFDADRGLERFDNARMWYPGVTRINDRYCKSEEEAYKVLDYAYKMWNGVHKYNENGERYEVQEAGPGIGVSLVCTPETDADQMIVKHVIKKRMVTDWETVEE